MMNLSFLPAALERLKKTKQTNPALFTKLKAIIEDTISHPSVGLGEPVPLEGRYKGIWTRKLSSWGILAYTFDDSDLVIVSITLQEPEGAAEGVAPFTGI